MGQSANEERAAVEAAVNTLVKAGVDSISDIGEAERAVLISSSHLPSLCSNHSSFEGKRERKQPA